MYDRVVSKVWQGWRLRKAHQSHFISAPDAMVGYATLDI
jgi:hypothetical protein